MNIYKTTSSGGACLDAVARSILAGWLGVAQLAFSCTIAAPAVAAEIAAGVEIEADTPYPLLHEGDVQEVEDPVGPITVSHQAGVGAVGGAANARVGLGWIQLNAFSDAIAGTTALDRRGTVTTTAAGVFTDELMITPDDPALLNQPGRAMFAVHMEGFVAKGDGPTGVEAGMSFPSQAPSTSTGQPPVGFSLANYSWGDFAATIDETLEFPHDIVFGQPFQIRVTMHARARASLATFNDITATFAESDLGNSLQWMGTAGVVDEFDQHVTDYTMTSSSGVDYRNPIEPPPPDPGLTGDFNGDATVDAADYTIWRDGLGEAFDAGDYEQWKQNFGAASSGAAGSTFASVPEPASLPLLALGGMAMRLLVHRRRACDLAAKRQTPALPPAT